MPNCLPELVPIILLQRVVEIIVPVIEPNIEPHGDQIERDDRGQQTRWPTISRPISNTAKPDARPRAGIPARSPPPSIPPSLIARPRMMTRCHASPGRSCPPPPAAANQPRALLARGVCRALEQLGYASLVEFPLANGRRADILALGKGGDLVIVEIKTFGRRFPRRPQMAGLSRLLRSSLFRRGKWVSARADPRGMWPDGGGCVSAPAAARRQHDKARRRPGAAR